MKLPSHVWLLVSPWTIAYQAPPSMEFSKQEYWSGFFFYMLCHKLCTACQSRSCPSASEEGGRQPVISTGHTEMSFFFFLNTPYGTWELSSPTRDHTWALCIVSVLSEPGTTGESQHWLEFKLFLLKMYNRWLIVFIGKCGQSWIKKMFPQINVLKFTIRN